MLLTVTIPGRPAPKQRPRVTKTGHAYTPAETVKAERWVKDCILEQVGRPMLDGALGVEIESRYEVPTSWSKKKQEMALAGRLRPMTGADVDNLAKLILDAAHGTLFLNDKTVVELRITKHFGLRAETVLRVWALEGPVEA